MVHPIEDGFLERDPYHKRSSAFATTKGLTTNEKPAPAVPEGDLATPGAEPELQNRPFGPLIPIGGRTNTSEPNKRSVPVVTCAKSPLSTSQASNTGSRLRTVTCPPGPGPEISAKSASQGNIKKKRRSLMTGEWPHPTEYLDFEAQHPPVPDSPPIRAIEYGNNDKAARILGLVL